MNLKIVESVNPFDDVYHQLLRDILEHGVDKGDRTGTGTRSLFGHQMRFDLAKGFPLLTTKKVAWKAIVVELLWFISGGTNAYELIKENVRIWDEWTPIYKIVLHQTGDKAKAKQAVQESFDQGLRANLELGPVYGHEWRNFGGRDHDDDHVQVPGVDQLRQVVERIKTNPDCRRLIVSAWNPVDLPEQALPPCHTLFQFYVANGKLSCQLYQRSADVFLGVPFNIASYALLTHLVAHATGLEVGHFVHTFGDVHAYSNHIDQIKEQLSRDSFAPPRVLISGRTRDLFDIQFDDIKLEGYQSHERIKADVSV